MGQQISAHLSFSEGYQGTLNLREGSIAIGVQDDQARPYDLLQGALVACLHSTFLEILTKKRIELRFADYDVSGEKRDEVPTMLQSVHVEVILPAGPYEDVYLKSMELATKYCSVYNTLSQVAKMSYSIKFR